MLFGVRKVWCMGRTWRTARVDLGWDFCLGCSMTLEMQGQKEYRQQHWLEKGEVASLLLDSKPSSGCSGEILPPSGLWVGEAKRVGTVPLGLDIPWNQNSLKDTEYAAVIQMAAICQQIGVLVLCPSGGMVCLHDSGEMWEAASLLFLLLNPRCTSL